MRYKVIYFSWSNEKDKNYREPDSKNFKGEWSWSETEYICRELEISRVTFYKWKSRDGGMEASNVKRLKELEEENTRLKKMSADLSLGHCIPKEVITRKGCQLRAAKAICWRTEFRLCLSGYIEWFNGSYHRELLDAYCSLIRKNSTNL